MAWSFSPDKPIFQQIMDIITADVISGKYQPNEKLASVRELAADAGVNPNTMQKALSELERTGLLITKRGDGRYVSQGGDETGERRERIVTDCIRQAVEQLRKLGLTDTEILDEFRKYFEEMDL